MAATREAVLDPVRFALVTPRRAFLGVDRMPAGSQAELGRRCEVGFLGWNIKRPSRDPGEASEDDDDDDAS